jgi:uncharacterized YigZ family protein
MSDTYKTIKAAVEGQFSDRGSKFISKAFPAKSEEEIKTILQQLRKTYHDARHHCFAYRLGADYKFWRINDDGEPSGSAGRPIFGQIQSYDLTNIAIVVIRYFGGTKLGIPGLFNAYRSATIDALSKAEIYQDTIKKIYDLAYEYPVMNDVMKIIKNEEATIIETNFELHCKIRFAIRQSKEQQIKKYLSSIKTTELNYINTV